MDLGWLFGGSARGEDDSSFISSSVNEFESGTVENQEKIGVP